MYEIYGIYFSKFSILYTSTEMIQTCAKPTTFRYNIITVVQDTYIDQRNLKFKLLINMELTKFRYRLVSIFK